jgi:two-component system response regulator TctD
MRLLLLEDSVRLRELLGETLRDGGYALDTVASAREFQNVIAGTAYDLLIIDLGLPESDGLDIIKELRSSGTPTPILVITARSSVHDRIAGLDTGADDYLVKPFNHSELLARVRALLRRPVKLAGPEFRIGRLSFRESTAEVLCEDKPLRLRPSEVRLFSLFLREAGSVVTKYAIEQTLSEFGKDVTPNAIEVLVSRLRKALSEADTGVSLITVRGSGYVLKEGS